MILPSIAGEVIGGLTAVAALAALLAGYVQFVLKRSTLAVEVDVTFTPLSIQPSDLLVGDLSCAITNLATSPLLVTSIRVRGRFRYRNHAPTGRWPRDLLEPDLPYSLKRLRWNLVPQPLDPWIEHEDDWFDLLAANATSSTSPSSPSSSTGPSSPSTSTVPTSDKPSNEEEEAERTFVFPGGTQHYRKPLALPSDTDLLSIWASCDYVVQLGWPSRHLARWFVPEESATR